MAFFAKTVQRKLLLLLLTLAFVPAGIGILYTYYGINVGFSQVLADLVKEEAQRTTRRLDDLVMGELSRFRALQSAIERAVKAEGPSASAADVAQILDAYVAEPGGVSLAVDLTEQGREPLAQSVRATTGVMDAMVPRLEPIEIPRGLFAGPEPRIFVTDASSQGDEILRILAEVAYPGREKGSTNSLVLRADVPLRLLMRRVQDPGLGSETRVLSNRGGQVVFGGANERLTEAVRNSADLFESFSSTIVQGPGDGGAQVHGVASSRALAQLRREARTSLAWLVVCSVGMDEARAVGSFLLWRSVLLGLVLVPFLILLSTVLAQRFLRPLRQIHASLDRLAEGRMPAPVRVDTGDEFQDLAEAYNRMAERIRAASLELLSQIRSSRRQAREVTLVNDVCQSLAAEFDRERLFATARAKLADILRHDCMSAVVADPAGHSTIHHYEGGAVRGTAHPDDVLAFCQASIRAAASRLGRPSGMFLTPTGTFSRSGIPHPDCHDIAIIPLLAGEVLIGALLMGRRSPDPFVEDDLQGVRPIARFLAVATEHIQLYERTANFAAELEETVRSRTEQLQAAHRQLLMTERFAATGKLAANIAHEINNPLGIIKNYLKIHRNSLGSAMPAEATEALSVMEEELDRIARIVRRLLDFYRTPSHDPAPIAINHEIETILALMRSTLEQKGITVELMLGHDVPMVNVVPDLLRQVILNICKNAEEAMEPGGTLMIATGRAQLRGRAATRLEIADTGCGIPQEHLSLIFEPFFTSKEEGQGTGLGLAVTYGIIQGMNGTIEVQSDVGLGTRILVTLPAMEPESVPPCPQSAPEKATTG